MKKSKLFLALILSAVLCMSAAACGLSSDSSSSADPFPTDWTVVPENTNENLKYFGYFHSDGFRSQGSYIREIAELENSNVLMINSAFSKEATLEKFAQAKEANMKVILSVHNLFEGGVLTEANTATLVSDYETVLTETTQNIKSYIDDGTLLSFYFDEPAWNGIKQNDFRTVTKWLRDNYPAIKVMTTMTVYDIGVSKRADYPELDPAYNEYCTDVMYDSYAPWNAEIRKGYLEKLKSKALQNQYIWGCATGFVDNPEQTDELFAALKGMYNEAVQEPRYAGIVAFSYADGNEGDWGYGLHSFLNNSSDYYDKELKKLYIDVGREVIGLPAFDHTQTIDLTLVEPNEVYDLGEKVNLPAAGAVDGNGNELALEYKLTSPSGTEMAIAPFTADESGLYKFEVTAKLGSRKQTKTCYIGVREEHEISRFETAAYVSDAGGGDDSMWCWPRQIDTTFSHSGIGSLKVTPHAKDGTWPRIVFGRNGYMVWDLTNASSVSLWAYNAGTEPIEGFALAVADEKISSGSQLFAIQTLPAKQWTKVTMWMANVKANKPDLDLTKVTVFYGNVASDYQNRSTFYLDDVTINYGEADPKPTPAEGVNSFETAADLKFIGDNADDLWTWPVSLSSEQSKSGDSSLKVTVRQDGGTWPNVVFKSSDSVAAYDLSNFSSLSFWLYFDSQNDYEYLGIKLCNMVGGGEANKVEKLVKAKAGEWTEFKIGKTDIPANSALDLTQVYVKLAQLGGTYTDRSNFYIDDFSVTEGTVVPDPAPVEGINSFETADDLAIIGNNAGDMWTWPVSISTDQARTGNSSLKVTVRQDGAVWPNVVFKASADKDTHDLTKASYISFWVYFDSDNDYEDFAIKVCNMANNVEGTAEQHSFLKKVTAKAREWTEFKVPVSEINIDGLDLANAYVKICNAGSGYTDRSNFYIDDFAVVENDVIVEGTNSFETADNLAIIGNNAGDLWTWPVSISGDKARTGNSSLKVTVRQDGAVWPNVVFKASADKDTHDLTKASYISFWVYFDSETDYADFAIKVCNMANNNEGTAEQHTFLKKVTAKAGEWTEFRLSIDEINVADLDLANAYVKIGNAGSGYTDRSNFYIDDFVVAAKA